MLQVHIPIWIPGRRGEDCDQQEGDDVQVRLHVHHNIASSTVNIDIAVTRPYQHHQSTLHHVSFKAKSTIINMTMSKMNYIYSNKKSFPKKFLVGTRALWRYPHVLICRSGTPTLFQRWAFFTPSGLRAYPCTFVEAWIIVCVVQGWLPWFYHNFQLFFSALS